MNHGDAVRGALFDNDERRILSWSEDKTLRLWDAATGAPIGAPMTHEGPVKGAQFDKDGRRILSWSEDRTLRLWDAATGAAIGAPMTHEGSVTGALFDQERAAHPVVVIGQDAQALGRGDGRANRRSR